MYAHGKVLQPSAYLNQALMRPQRQSNYRLVNTILLDNCSNLVQRAQYRVSINPQALLLKIVVNESNDGVPALGVPFQILSRRSPNNACSNDENFVRLPVALFVNPNPIKPPDDAKAKQKNHIQQEEENKKNPGGFLIGEVKDTGKGERGGNNRRKDVT